MKREEIIEFKKRNSIPIKLGWDYNGLINVRILHCPKTHRWIVEGLLLTTIIEGVGDTPEEAMNKFAKDFSEVINRDTGYGWNEFLTNDQDVLEAASK